MRHFKLAQQLILLGVLYNIVFGIDDFEITSSGTCTTAFDLVVQYTVPGTVDIVSWKFDKMADTTKTLDIVTAICQASLGADPAFPTGRMTYQCDNTNRKYTVTISSFNETTDAGKWEAKVSVGGSFTNFKEINIKCQGPDPGPDPDCFDITIRVVCIIIICLVGLGMKIVAIICYIIKKIKEKKTFLILEVAVIVLFIICIGIGISVLTDKDIDHCPWQKKCAQAFEGIAVSLVIIDVIIMVLVYFDKIKPFKKAYKAKEAKHPGENHGMTGTSM